MGRLRTAGSAIFLAIGGFLFGYDSGIISSTLAQPLFISYMGDPTNSEAGGIVSSFTGGAILGALSIAFLADRLGRKKTVFIGSLISVFGCTLQGAAANIPMMIAGRLIAGFAVGLLAAIVPMYCSEISTSEDRGKLSGLLQFMLAWGFFAAQWIGYGCNHAKTNFQWRFPLCFQILPGFILVCGTFFLSESPRWLCEKQRYDEAKLVLAKLHATGSNEEFLELEFREIRDTIIAEKAIAVKSWKQMVTKPSWRRRLALGMGVQAFGQLSGINVINYYGPRIYQLLGFSTSKSLELIGINGSFGIIECFLGLFILDKVGRKKPLIVSALGMACCLLINSVLGHFFVFGNDANPNNNALRAMVAMYFLFQFFFTMTGIISWVYPAEIFPAEIRARGNSISAVTNWCLNLVFAQCAPIALGKMQFSFFYFFFAFNLVAMTAYILFYPETKNKTLEQMDQLFGDQLVPHALQDSAAAEAVMEDKYRVGSVVSHVEGVTPSKV